VLLKTPMDKLENYRHTMESCNHCGQCKWTLGPKARGWDFAEICPIHMRYHFDAYSGQGLIHIAQELLNGELQYEAGMVDLIYSCTTCGACDINCKSIRDMEVLDTILALRARCVEDKQGPMPEHTAAAAAVAESHNIYGRPHDQRFDWISRDVRLSEASRVAYFVGCASCYVNTDIASNTAKILNAGGFAFTVLNGDEYCCGGPLWRTGQVEAAKRQATHNLEAFASHGIQTVVTSCAECFGTLRGFYPRIGPLDVEVVHISEVIRQLLAEGRLALSKPQHMKVTYHDPCLLGRLSEPYVPWNGEIKTFGYHEPPKQWRRGNQGVYDAPREVLHALPGIEVVEMVRTEENSFCCGGGGGVRAAFPEFAQWTAAERLREAEAAGAQTVVSCCPFCRENLQGTIDARGNPLRYRDLTQLVADAL
jgi:Fe-S oxidoreductase